MECFVYCLATIDEPVKTYVGATTNVDKRLAQHNGLLSGGARATSARPAAWYRICYVKGFTIWTTALSFEWHWKHYSRRLDVRNPLERRKRALDLTMEWAEKKGLTGLEIVYSE